MRTRPALIALALALAAATTGTRPAGADPAPGPAPTADPGGQVQRIAFGSCFDIHAGFDIFDAVHRDEPDVFLFLGDNIYADTADPQVMRGMYAKLGAVAGVARLFRTTRVLATWDDHDYGANDAGAEFPARAASQEAFLDFLGVPWDSPRRRREGVYHSESFGPDGRRVQVIMLDTRYHRSALRWRDDEPMPGDGRPGPYAPNDRRDATVLGEAQWAWLEERLREPADLRVIASSIQVVAEGHGWECWANFPRERERLFRLVRETEASGVVFLSGDRHSAELSLLDPQRVDARWRTDPGYPMWDVTSSSLNKPRAWRSELNAHRVGGVFFGPNYGVLEIDWDRPEPTLTVSVRDADGADVIRRTLRLNELSAR